MVIQYCLIITTSHHYSELCTLRNKPTTSLVFSALGSFTPQCVCACETKTQGVVTPIGTVVTAATGVIKFLLSFLLLDHLTAPQTGSWPFDRTHLTTLCAIRTCKTLTSWPQLPSLKIVLDRLTDTKKQPLTASWPRLQLWVRCLWEWPPLETWPTLRIDHTKIGM